MRRMISVLTLAAAFGALLAGSADARPPASPVAGDWTGIDDVDGSTLTMTVSRGRSMQVSYHDDGGTVCVDNGYGFVPASFRGKGTVVSTAPLAFAVTADVVCHTDRGRRTVIEDLTITFTYDEVNDQLWDDLPTSECYHRPGAPAC